MARPSSPSVRFTALEAPTITNMATMTKNQPSGSSRSLTNGIARPVSMLGGASQTMAIPAAMPMTTWAMNLSRLRRPRLLRLVSFR